MCNLPFSWITDTSRKYVADIPSTKPNRDTDSSSSSNEHHSDKSTNLNKDNKSDESNNGNECPDCGRTFKNPKGLQMHRSSKHNRKQNTPTSAGFWPCCSDKRCDICKQGSSARPCLVRKARKKNIKSNSQSHVKLKTCAI